MNKLIFQVEFLSDIVLPASSNTQGNIEQLDFIPGSNFLGMVASRYPDFENSFQIFHSGDVKFGDATILKDDKQTYKMPLSYFHKKLDDKTIYNHHYLKDDDFKELGQLKQKRNGYITQDNQTIDIEYNYLQKSAYDKEHRRSKEGFMYGYSAIKSGTKWQFCISYNDITTKDEELLISSIVGQKRLGKSKSAQYGLINITQVQNNISTIEDKNSQETILYANSRLALFDNDGNPTFDIKHLFEGLKEKNIDYAKCQIKTSSFTPYNSKRKTKDYERVCINKGSVIVLKDIDKSIIPQFVGAYQSEGFGEILINPSFLLKKEFSFTKDIKEDKTKKELPRKSDLTKFLANKYKKKIDKLDILDKVDEFINNNKKLYEDIKPSQWGKIRSICSSQGTKKEIEDYISDGTRKWEQKQIDKLLDFSDDLDTIKLLSIQMPKVNKGGQK